MSRELLLITPPFTQLNTPYPATAYIKGFLATKNISSFQMDLGIEVTLELFTARSFARIFELAEGMEGLSDNSRRILALKKEYLGPLNQVIGFLQGKNLSFARQVCSMDYLPRASRFDQLDDLDWAFGHMGMVDKAKHLATLYLEDLSDFIVECVDPHFGFSRYAEVLGQSANQFDELYATLQEPPTFVDAIALGILEKRIAEVDPKMVCFSVPFPGNLYSAFRCAGWIKEHFPHLVTCMGGGFPNTELRSLKDSRVFQFFDFITLDDGERPIELLANHVLATEGSKTSLPLLKRTYMLNDGQVFYNNTSTLPDYRQSEVGTPDYSDLRLNEYISVIEIANPMHSLWSDGRWNKLTMAHGCYWGKCTFCDVSLDYIKVYEPVAARMLVDRMQILVEQTGTTGFHFVDEAAPPALMRELALEIIRRGLQVTWWTNIRFEKRFTRDLCRLLKHSGCIAVSGGLEVASDRLLALIDKGVTVEQVARVTRNFTESGIMVHAYLMYGYPTQTVQETIDSMEMVRQLFEEGVLQSGFWHRFALTAHSPIGLNPEAFQVIPERAEVTFADNEVPFRDKTGVDHARFSFGLKKSLFNFMHGIGFEMPLQDWFDFKVPKTRVPLDFIATCLEADDAYQINPLGRLIWLGSHPEVQEHVKTKKGRRREMSEWTIHTSGDTWTIALDREIGGWMQDFLERIRPGAGPLITWKSTKAEFEELGFGDFEPFWASKAVTVLRKAGLLVV
ncbi:MAG: radical SAM protein [Lunatimonas sp.]|uniref:B12-binding domain-containing radical SAM protein n=1 Tax=Lunatimonas sp. TaxID=2060141 RepID=UPI00263BDE28|nr:radical SAM protein [Lunatimonas sp.]MCC5938374.1 radical SAM protein [Lunatimonas sp.]